MSTPAPSNDDTPEPAGQRRTLVAASTAHALHDGFTDMIYVLLPVWQSEFALSYGLLGLLRGLYSGAMAGLQVLAASLAPAAARDGSNDVDVELVLAVDISYSMDPEEQALQRAGDLHHAAVHQPDAVLLDVRHQHQRRGRRERRRTAVGRVAREQLLQPWIVKAARQTVPQGTKRTQAGQGQQPPGTQVPHQAHGLWPLGTDVGALQVAVEVSRFRAEGVEPPPFGGRTEAGNGVFGGGRLRVEIQ